MQHKKRTISGTIHTIKEVIHPNALIISKTSHAQNMMYQEEQNILIILLSFKSMRV